MLYEQFNPLREQQLQVMDKDGRVIRKDLMPKLSNDDLKKIYYYMVLGRAADQKAMNLQRQGRIGTFAPVYGQEAQVASAYALQQGDWVVPAFREHALALVRGMPLKNFYLYYMGHETGSVVPKDARILPVSVPVGSHPLHAVGIAWASKIRKEKNVAITYFGDGATSEGEFHEAMNFAGVLKVPVIFYCQNNQWAISVPRKIQTASRTIAQKAVAYGMPGIQIDGNDIFAVYAATKEAVDRARRGEGPYFIEAVTYRFGPHTTADDPTKYRDEKEVEFWKQRCPVMRLKKYMTNLGIWDDSQEKKLLEAVDKEIETAVADAEKTPIATVDEIFDNTFAQLTPQLAEQKAYLKKVMEEKKTRTQK
ncbi:TPA: pyruvate dehydrogenase (acetyl-transferring) E1 component subunit alpha [Candidatus Woesearchaeota archaeon]|nr:pyruvate dehydrogenase (acetyl-transferring) E1 component subunit alpha [Candidatus Woesearchaeota archaeon]